ncbi:HesA/MoeB/ThiF family protein [uncultured Porticoccus sp.]|uniref:HesA/MoeB/ThiF family protein n=1 Tax=uncultured Porticoccus sp. TaxID=1256050 RepID=UPI002634EEB5|nr:HesA/MoeB/ThiF family protein [uncultured Porticoccus sp.]
MNENITSFSASEWLRYTRHIQLPEVGAAGQLKLKQSHILVIGAGGLGSPVALYLAAAGIGHLTLVDGDVVDTSNLQRQIIFEHNQVGQPKALAAKDRLLRLNPDIRVDAVEAFLGSDNATKLVGSADLVVDCTDNFSARYLINDYCCALGKPWLFASIQKFFGQCALFTPGNACFRCLFPEPPINVEDCNSAGVIGVLPGLLGVLQANEAIKYLLGLPTPLQNHLLLVDALNLEFRSIQLTRSDNCAACGNLAGAPNLPRETPPQCTLDTRDIDTREGTRLNPEDFRNRHRQGDCVLLDVRSPTERQAFHIGGQHIPLDELPQRLTELEGVETVLCYCQSGVRSGKALALLKELGFNGASLDGGLLAWLRFIEAQEMK